MDGILHFKMGWLDNKNSSKTLRKQLKTANHIHPWAYIQEGLLSERYLHLRFWGLIFGRAYFQEAGGTYYDNFTVCAVEREVSSVLEPHLAKFTMAHGIPVGVLNAGRSLSPTSLAFTLKT